MPRFCLHSPKTHQKIMPVLQASFSHSGNPSCLCRGFLGEEKVKWEWEGSCSPCACVIPIKQNQTRARIFWSQFLILPGTSGICSQNKNGKSETAHVLIYHIIQIRICILKTRKGIVSSSRIRYSGQGCAFIITMTIIQPLISSRQHSFWQYKSVK